MMMEEVLDELEKAEDRAQTGAELDALRLPAVRRIAQLLTEAAEELAEATADWEAAMLRRIERRGSSKGPGGTCEDRLVNLRHQVQWGKAAWFADLACLLLNQAMGGCPVSADTAGISLNDKAREKVAWLGREGYELQAGFRQSRQRGTLGKL